MKSPTGMRGFTIIWLGQIVSLLGSAMTWFAFTIWAWEKTGRASALATISFFAFLPTFLLAPVAGAFIDRWNRKLVMLLSDFATALGTLTVFLIYTFGDLQIWYIYLAGILAGFFTAFQYPAYAAVTTILSKKDYTFAFGTLLLIHIPQPGYTATGLQSRGTLWQEIVFGFRYIQERPGPRAHNIIYDRGNLSGSRRDSHSCACVEPYKE